VNSSTFSKVLLVLVEERPSPIQIW